MANDATGVPQYALREDQQRKLMRQQAMGLRMEHNQMLRGGAKYGDLGDLRARIAQADNAAGFMPSAAPLAPNDPAKGLVDRNQAVARNALQQEIARLNMSREQQELPGMTRTLGMRTENANAATGLAQATAVPTDVTANRTRDMAELEFGRMKAGSLAGTSKFNRDRAENDALTPEEIRAQAVARADFERSMYGAGASKGDLERVMAKRMSVPENMDRKFSVEQSDAERKIAENMAAKKAAETQGDVGSVPQLKKKVDELGLEGQIAEMRSRLDRAGVERSLSSVSMPFQEAMGTADSVNRLVSQLKGSSVASSPENARSAKAAADQLMQLERIWPRLDETQRSQIRIKLLNEIGAETDLTDRPALEDVANFIPSMLPSRDLFGNQNPVRQRLSAIQQAQQLINRLRDGTFGTSQSQ